MTSSISFNPGRTPCPSCSCGFSDDRTLFSDLTSTKVQAIFKGIKNKLAFSQWIREEHIHIIKEGSDWVFPRGICKSVQNKILKKISDLGIDTLEQAGQNDLFGEELLPGSDPDDEPPKQIGNPSGILLFEASEDQAPPDWITLQNAWKGEDPIDRQILY